ncbi:MAG TPA: NRDE family protein [Croceibacterium sp.]|nr:NRDE family protein [Croceibacterium sp.]
MCVLAVAWRAHPRWLLVVAGNRDELHARPAQALSRWDKPDHVIAGRDLQSGGTWLGVSEQGRFAVVTNLGGYDAPDPDRASRGALATDVLAGEGRYADPDAASLADFNPFNLIVADRDRARFLSNRPEPLRKLLVPGIYGLSNGALDEPWPKTTRLKAGLGEWIADEHGRPETLLDLLREDHSSDDELALPLQSRVPPTPAQSPIFIRDSTYGTRCSTVVGIDDRGLGFIIERRYDAHGAAVGESSLEFSWKVEK